MRQAQTTFSIHTDGRGLFEFTNEAARWLRDETAGTGQLTLFCRHTSASLTIQENADPDVQRDLHHFFKRLVPENDPNFRHVLEGADDMPAHIKSTLTDVSLTIPVRDGTMVLGTWQGLFLFEHRRHPHQRRVVGHYIGT